MILCAQKSWGKKRTWFGSIAWGRLNLSIKSKMFCHRNLLNVWLLSISFMLLFSAFNTCQNLVSSLFKDVGFYSLCAIYISVCFLKPFAPSIVERLGERTVLFIGSACYVSYLAAWIFVIDAVVYATAALLGLGGALLWCAQGSFLTLNSTPKTRGTVRCIVCGS